MGAREGHITDPRGFLITVLIIIRPMGDKHFSIMMREAQYLMTAA